MMKIRLFLQDFRDFVKSKAFKSEENLHPVFYWEDDTEIYFYKPEGYVLYYLHILKTDKLPEGDTIAGLKIEFVVTEIPEQLVKPKQFQGIIG